MSKEPELKKLKNLTGPVLRESPFLKSIKPVKDSSLKSRLFGNNVRKLHKNEIEELKKQGNTSDDWDSIFVTDEFTTSGIFYSSFYGKCCIGKSAGFQVSIHGSFTLPQGIYRSTIINSEIGNNCVIHDTGVISNYIVHDQAVLLKNGSISASVSCTFGNGVEIAVGNETGGREILSYADLTIPVAEAVAKNRSDKAFLNEYNEFIELYLSQCNLSSGYIGKKAVIRNTAAVEDAYIGDDVVITGAVLIKNSTLLASPEEKTEISHGAYVRDACVQWGSEITTMAIVDKSVLCEHSHVERHGKVTSSIIGPNTGVAEGEVTSCLLGPFVGFHHQAMLIAAIWPEGKGNVAYGANIGSNHTSKSPDQEIWCGEGLFFGLGTNIKFPSDFSKAPYSIIATGVDTLPQKLEFPFSLLNKPAAQIPGIPPAYNEILPAWVLSGNIYSVRRNEGKYKKRNKARRSNFTFTVFRPDILDMMIEARDSLKTITSPKELYTIEDIPGIGKNYLTEENRKAGINTYELYIEYYALLQLLEQITAVQNKQKPAVSEKIHENIYNMNTDNSEWEHARKILIKEGYSVRSIRDNLLRLTELVKHISASTAESKERDDERGKKIIPDYSEVNTLANDDSFVKETINETAALISRIESILALFSTVSSPFPLRFTFDSKSL